MKRGLFIKKLVDATKRVIPVRFRNYLKQELKRAVGTQEINEFLRRYDGDIQIYNELLKSKSEVTEYHVDKIIKTIGDKIVKLEDRVETLERFIKESRKG